MRKTPAQQAGWKVGDRGVVNEDSFDNAFSKGSLVQLYRDNGSRLPLFKLIKGSSSYDHADGQPGAFLFLYKVDRVEKLPLLQRLRTYILGIDPQTLAYAREIASRDSGKRKRVAEALLKVSGG